MRCSLNSLDSFANNSLRLPLWDKASAEFYFAKSRELLTKPFPSPRVPYNSCRDLNDSSSNIPRNYANLETHMQDLSLGVPFYGPSEYRDRTLTKSESLSRKTYSSELKRRLGHNRAFFSDPLTPAHIPYQITRNNVYYNERQPSMYHANGYDAVFTPEINYDDVFVYDNHSYVDETRGFLDNLADTTDIRPRTLSFSDSQENLPKKCGKTIRERNLRRQSYNPQAYAESSSSDSDCMSLGSVDLDWRRRRRLRRLSTSNSSIRSELGAHARLGIQFLKPEGLAANVTKGRSPPPSNSMLSGLSPTTAARKRQSDSSSGSST